MRKFLLLALLPLLLLTGCNSKQETSEEGSSLAPAVEPIEVEETNNYTKENHTIARDGLKIVGELYLPDNSFDVFPLIILSHGFGGNMSSTRNDAITFTKKGFASFVFDFIGGGYSIQSDGQLTDMSVLTEAKDLNAVIDYLIDFEEIDENHIFLLGQSQGGFVSTYVAATRDDIKGLLDFYPALCIKDDALAEYPDASKVTDPYYLSKMGANLGKIYYTDVVSFDIYEVMANYEGDTLIVHGTNDNIVPVSYARRASETIPNCTYIEIPGAGHGFSGKDNETAINACLELTMNNLD